MKKIAALLAIWAGLGLTAQADTVILSEGASYTGQFMGTVIHFKDQQGIQYTFPKADVQTLAFNASVDTVTLRNGKSYTGHFTGTDPINFTGAEGIQYQFPVHDVESLVFNSAGRIAPVPEQAKVIPFGTDVVVRTEETIDSKTAVEGQVYAAEIARDIKDADGAVVIPRASNAAYSTATAIAWHSVLMRRSISVKTRANRRKLSQSVWLATALSCFLKSSVVGSRLTLSPIKPALTIL